MNTSMKIRQLVTLRRYATLTSTNALAETLNSGKADKTVVLDCTFSNLPEEAFTETYLKHHIPGAKFFNHHTCVTSSNLVPRNIPEPYCFTKKLRQFGISGDSNVVVYDTDRTPCYAARVWWLLRLFGHERVSILDGGLSKWIAEGHDVHTNGQSGKTRVEGDFSPRFNLGLIRDKSDVTKIVGDKTAQICDARAPQFFTGAIPHSESLTGGHIPGAINVPNSLFYKEDGTFKSADEIKTVFEDSGVNLAEPMVSMCRTGIFACALASAAHITGNEQVPVYYGSWMEWAQTNSDLVSKPEDRSQG